MPPSQPETATMYGECHEHYPVGFDDGRALDCQKCGHPWPCGKQTHTAKMDALSENGSREGS